MKNMIHFLFATVTTFSLLACSPTSVLSSLKVNDAHAQGNEGRIKLPTQCRLYVNGDVSNKLEEGALQGNVSILKTSLPWIVQTLVK